MGPLSRPEKTMLGTFCILLVLWVFGNNFGIPAAATALLGLCILLITNVLTWDEITEEKAAWNTFLWFAPFLMMTSALSQLGLITWVQQSTQPLLMGISWPVALAIAVVIQLYIHYGMASITAHVSALYAPLLVVVMGAGAPKGLSVLLLAFTAILSGSLTHFSTGSAPIYYGAGFLTTKEWWKISFIVCTLNVLIYSTIGSLWWFLLGLW
jgi:DASS family divalent anion:Na+ symporter